MPAPVGVGNISAAQHAFKGRPQIDADSAESAKGRSAESPAHKARTKIEATLAASDLGKAAPANLHGKVTSAIARGIEIDISSLLVLQTDNPTDAEIPEDGSAPASDIEEGSAPLSDDQSLSEGLTSSDADESSPAVGESVTSAEVEETTADPAIAEPVDNQFVDLLIKSLDEKTTQVG